MAVAAVTSNEPSGLGGIAPSPVSPLRLVGRRSTNGFFSRFDESLLKKELLVSALGVIVFFLTRMFAALPALSTSREGLFYFSSLLESLIACTTVVFGARATFALAWDEIRTNAPRGAFCEALAILVSLAGQLYALFLAIDSLITQPIYYSPVLIVFFVAVLRYVELSVFNKAERNIGISLNALAPLVRVVRGLDSEQSEVIVSVDEVKIGETFVVRSGECIPLDSEIISGKAEVIEHKYGGAGISRFKSPGQGVFAGSKVLSGELRCKVSSEQRDSVYGGFLSNLDKSLSDGSEVGAAVRVSTIYSLAVLFVAACACLFWHDRGAPFPELAYIVTAVLLSNMLPRILVVLSLVPGAVLTKLFLRGATLKDLNVVRTIAKVKNLVLDYESLASKKTLTVTKFEIMDERVDERSLTSVLLALLGDWDDDFACSAVKLLRERLSTPTLFEVADSKFYLGKGACGSVSGTEFSVGEEVFLIERGVQLQTSEIEHPAEGSRHLYVALNDEVVGRFTVIDDNRAAQKLFAEKIVKQGIKALLCGPDAPEKVDAMAKTLGIELACSYGNLSGEEYKERVLRWKPVAFYSQSPLKGEVSRVVDVSISHFDDLRWNERATDVTIYQPASSQNGALVLSDVFALCNWMHKVRFQILIPAMVLSTALVLSAFLDLFAPALVIITITAAFSAASLIALAPFAQVGSQGIGATVTPTVLKPIDPHDSRYSK